MQCQDVLNMLSAYLDGALDSTERETVRIHLARCPECRRELEELKVCLELLRELPELTPPTEFHNELMKKIDQLSQRKQASLLDRLNNLTRKTWYRTATVAAVLAMTLGITSIWDQQGRQLMPGEPQSSKSMVVERKPQEHSSGSSDINIKVEPGKQGPITPEHPNSTDPVKQQNPAGPVQRVPVTTETPKPITRQVENFTPQPSEDLVAISATLKLDVEDIEAALKAIGKITQAGGGQINSGYDDSGEGGTMSIKIPRSAFDRVTGALQQIGTVIAYLPNEKDLSDEHKNAKQKFLELQQKEAELRAKVTANSDAQSEQDLAEVQASLQEQINILKGIEDRSTYCVITINLI